MSRRPLWLFGLGCAALAQPLRSTAVGKPLLAALLALLAFSVGAELVNRRAIGRSPWPGPLYLLPIAGVVLLPLSDSPRTSLVAALTLVASISLASFVANRRSSDQIIRSIEIALTALLIAGLALYPLSISVGPQGWTGLFYHKNELGRIAGLVVIFGIYRWRQADLRRAAPLLSSGSLTLLFAQSATPVVAILIAVVGARVMSATRRTRVTRAMVLSGSGIGLGFGVQALGLGSAPIQFVGEMLGRRTDRNTVFVRESLWRWAIDEAMTRPWAGRGLGVPLTDGEDIRVFTGNGFVDWSVTQPHNGFIEAFYQLGVVGLAALAIGIFWTTKQGQGRLPTEIGVYFLLLNFSYSLMIAQGTLIRTIWYTLALSAASGAHRGLGRSDFSTDADVTASSNRTAKTATRPVGSIQTVTS